MRAHAGGLVTFVLRTGIAVIADGRGAAAKQRAGLIDAGFARSAGVAIVTSIPRA